MYVSVCMYALAGVRVNVNVLSYAMREHYAVYFHTLHTRVTVYTPHYTCLREGGGWGRDQKKCTGRGWGMGSSTI